MDEGLNEMAGEQQIKARRQPRLWEQLDSLLELHKVSWEWAILAIPRTSVVMSWPARRPRCLNQISNSV